MFSEELTERGESNLEQVQDLAAALNGSKSQGAEGRLRHPRSAPTGRDVDRDGIPLEEMIATLRGLVTIGDCLQLD
jgi:hypothetical protein